ncbi:MAG: hypothetical protein OXC06_15740 [Acidimicrobiaceae bacterium]|nr:hypothetical protein [Acidimicrobiaceae bacterium]
MHVKPPSLFDREPEWDDLTGFASAAGPRLRLGILYGRRRYGKSYLLRRLQESVGGLYHLALQEERRSALDRFAAAVGRLQAGTPPLRFDDWRAALGYAAAGLGDRGAGPQVLVLDEYPYLRQGSAELDSAVQAVMDEAAGGDLGSGWAAPVAVIVCGSAMSVMTGILSGTSPMRGRAALDMPLAPFDYRQSRRFWGIEDPAAAFAVDAVVGGAPGYKDLTAAAGAPSRPEDLAGWLSATVLNPSHALFREDEYLLREDPRVTAEAPYYSLLQAIAGGRASQGRIAEAAGRAPGDIVHHLNVMTTAGFVVRDEDLLTARRPAYRVADPIVRFHHLITRRRRAMLEDRRAAEVWAGAGDTFRSGIVGPHLESVCRRWVDRYAGPETLGGPVGPARRVQVNDRSRRQSFELDLAAAAVPAPTAGGRQPTVIHLLGESKASRLDTADLARLDRIAALLNERDGVSVAPAARRLLFSLEGFTPELAAEARNRHDVELVDLDRLYEGD